MKLPTLSEMHDQWAGKPLPKGKSRLQERVAQQPLIVVDDAAFKAEVRKRDHHRCRMCHRKVVYVTRRQPDRGEVHHLHGKLGDLKFEAKSALLLCLVCHEKCTGRVAEKWVIFPTRQFELNGQKYTDARYEVRFERVA